MLGSIQAFIWKLTATPVKYVYVCPKRLQQGNMTAQEKVHQSSCSVTLTGEGNGLAHLSIISASFLTFASTFRFAAECCWRAHCIAFRRCSAAARLCSISVFSSSSCTHFQCSHKGRVRTALANKPTRPCEHGTISHNVMACRECVATDLLHANLGSFMVAVQAGHTLLHDPHLLVISALTKKRCSVQLVLPQRDTLLVVPAFCS